MDCKYICHFSTPKIDRLKKLKQLLDRELRNSDIRNAKQTTSYNWGVEDRCKYQIYCHKISQSRNEYNRLSTDVGNLLDIYIENRTYDHYHEILNLLRGYFPIVYTQFEKQILKNK